MTMPATPSVRPIGYALALVRRPTSLALMLRGTGALFGFLVTFLIARTFGAATLGEYALVVQAAIIAGTIALFGLDYIIVRTIGGDVRSGHFLLANAMIAQAFRFARRSALLIVLAAVLLATQSERIGIGLVTVAGAAAAAAIWPMVRICVASLRASGRIVLSQLVDGPVQGATQVVILATLFLAVQQGWTLSRPGDTVITIYVLSLGLTALVSRQLLRRATRDWPMATAPRLAAVLPAGWPIVMAVGTHMVTDWLLMAVINGNSGLADVGTYRVAMQVITVITMIVTTIESVANPGYAGDFRVGDYARARQRHRRSTMLMMLAAGVPAVGAIVLANPIMQLFGTEIGSGALALQIMLGAQLVSIIAGPIGGLLLMAGRERMSLTLAIAGLLLSVTLAVLLVPRFGVAGAAIGYAAGIILRNAASYIFVFSSRELSRSGGWHQLVKADRPAQDGEAGP